MRPMIVGALWDGSSPGHLWLQGLRRVATLGFCAAGVPGGFGSCTVGETRDPVLTVAGHTAGVPATFLTRRRNPLCVCSTVPGCTVRYVFLQRKEEKKI